MEISIKVVNPPKEKPLMLYDGECDFCCRWAIRVQKLTGSCVDIIPYQQGFKQFPEIEKEDFATEIKLVETTGDVHSGAQAICRALSYGPGLGWIFFFYKRLSFFRWLARKVYGKVSCTFRRK